jgi:hypothetical protein
VVVLRDRVGRLLHGRRGELEGRLVAQQRHGGDGRFSMLATAWPWLKLVLGIGLLVLLGWLVDWPGTWRTLRHADPGLVLLATVILVAALLVSTAKWQRLAGLACGRLGFALLLRAYWIGTFLSNYLPSNVGGDVARVLVLREAAGMVPLAGSVLVERLTGVATLALLSAVCLTLRPVQPANLNLVLWLLVLAIAAAIALALVAGGRMARGGDALVAGLPSLARRIAAKLAKFGAAVADYRRAPGELAIALAWSSLFYGVLVLFQFTVLRAVGSSISLADAAVVAPLVPLVSLVPITANGLGLTEGAFVLFYTQMGVPPEQAFAAAILRRLVTIAVSVPGGLLWLRRPNAGALLTESRG